jgi:hypothetical protein
MIRMIPTSTQIQMGTFMRARYPDLQLPNPRALTRSGAGGIAAPP